MVTTARRSNANVPARFDGQVPIVAAGIAAAVAVALWWLTSWRERRSWLRDRRLALYADLLSAALADIAWLRTYSAPGQFRAIEVPDDLPHARSVVAARCRVLATPAVQSVFLRQAVHVDFALWLADHMEAARDYERSIALSEAIDLYAELETVIRRELMGVPWWRQVMAWRPGRSEVAPRKPAIPAWGEWARGQVEEHFAEGRDG